VVDEPASEQRRAQLRADREDEPFFDRGPGYATLSGGRRAAECDWL
jgi:N-methylhydantoinase B